MTPSTAPAFGGWQLAETTAGFTEKRLLRVEGVPRLIRVEPPKGSEPRLRSAKNGDGKVANRLTVWRLSQQCHGVRKRVASVKVCPLGGPAISWRW